MQNKIHLMNPVSLGLDQRISSLLHWRGCAKPVWSHVKLFGERSPKSDKSTLIFHSSSKFTQLLEVIRPAQKYRIARAHWFVGSNVHLAGITSATSRASCAPLRTQVSKIFFFQNQLCVESWWEKIIESRGYNGSYWSGVFVLWGKAGITLKITHRMTMTTCADQEIATCRITYATSQSFPSSRYLIVVLVEWSICIIHHTRNPSGHMRDADIDWYSLALWPRLAPAARFLSTLVLPQATAED